MARATRRSKKTAGVRLDLSKVEARVAAIEDGDYPLSVITFEKKQGNVAEYLEWKFEVADSDPAFQVYFNTSLSEQSLWSLRTMLEALGIDIPDSEFDLDPNEVAGLTMMGSLQQESYEGKRRSKLVDFWPMEEGEEAEEEEDDEDEEEEAPPAKKPRKSRAKKKVEEEPEEDEEEDDEEEEEAPPAKRGRGRPKKAAAAKAKPARKSKKAALSQDDINDMSQEELADLIEEHELDVDLDDFRTLRKMKIAVIDAAEEAELL